jgi:hypothetical protein
MMSIVVPETCWAYHKCNKTLRPWTHYPHVTWTCVMLRVQLGYLTLNSGADPRFCHSAYVTWSDVELWSAPMRAHLLNFCWRTHFVRRNICHFELTWCTFRETWRDVRCVRQQKFKRRAGMWTPRRITWRKQSDRSVNVRQNSMLNVPNALVTSR